MLAVVWYVNVKDVIGAVLLLLFLGYLGVLALMDWRQSRRRRRDEQRAKSREEHK